MNLLRKLGYTMDALPPRWALAISIAVCLVAYFLVKEFVK